MTIRRPHRRRPDKSGDQPQPIGDRQAEFAHPNKPAWTHLLSSWPLTLRALTLALPTLGLLLLGLAKLPSEVITALLELLPY